MRGETMGITPLAISLTWYASDRLEYRDVAIALIERGADVNCVTSYMEGSYTFSALSIAATLGDADLVELLLRHGADPNAISSRGSSVLTEAISSEDEETVLNVLKAGATVTPGAIGYAKSKRSHAIVVLLRRFERGARVGSVSDD